MKSDPLDCRQWKVMWHDENRCKYTMTINHSAVSDQPELGADSWAEGLTGKAMGDILASLSNWRLWTMLGWLDIRQRYRRSMLGAFWITISMAIMVVALGILYSS